VITNVLPPIVQFTVYNKHNDGYDVKPVTNDSDKSAVFLTGTDRSYTLMSVIYLHSGG